MARLIPDEQMAELAALAKALLDRARELTVGGALTAPGAPPEEVALHEEVQAYATSVMALSRDDVAALAPPALFVGLGAAVGVILAQAEGPHAELLRLMRSQEKGAYDETMRVSTPISRSVN